MEVHHQSDDARKLLQTLPFRFVYDGASLAFLSDNYRFLRLHTEIKAPHCFYSDSLFRSALHSV